MTLTDETLMAYADGEVDAETRAIIESAMREDPEVRARVERHRALRVAVHGAFCAVLEEPVPARLIDAARRSRTRGWQPAALAASLLIGLGLGYRGWHNSNTLMKSDSSGGLIAGAGLADALSTRLAADRSLASVAVTGISFRNKAGDFCRTFSLTGAAASSGLACRESGSWKIKVLAQSAQPAGDPPNFRQAGSDDTPAVRAAVEESIAGEPLDQAGEIAARRSGWDAARR